MCTEKMLADIISQRSLNLSTGTITGCQGTYRDLDLINCFHTFFSTFLRDLSLKFPQIFGFNPSISRYFPFLLTICPEKGITELSRRIFKGKVLKMSRKLIFTNLFITEVEGILNIASLCKMTYTHFRSFIFQDKKFQ